MPSESCTAVDNFLRDVDEQISCKTGLDSVNRELRGHIEEKAELYMEYGVEKRKLTGGPCGIWEPRMW